MKSDKQDWKKKLDKLITRKSKGGDNKGEYVDWWFVKEGVTPKLIKSFIQSELDRQRKEILLNYFEKEDDLVDNYANLKDDNWSNFLEERSKLKIKSLKSK